MVAVKRVGQQQRMAGRRPDADTEARSPHCQSQPRSGGPTLRSEEQNMRLSGEFQGITHTISGRQNQ